MLLECCALEGLPQALCFPITDILPYVLLSLPCPTFPSCQGNVALDVARILLQPPSALSSTDIADHALQQLKRSTVR